MREARFSHGLVCVRCGATRVQRWGSFSGRQRYRCTGCRRTFSDLTGTPAAYVKKLHLWPRYGRCLDRALPVRRAAARVGVHPCTAFRWRHRLLDPLRAGDGEQLEGWIEIGSLRLPYSEKGKRHGGSSPGAGSQGESGPQARPNVTVAVACDRLGHVITDVNGIAIATRLDRHALARMLASRIDRRPTVIAKEGRYGPASLFAHQQCGTFHDARGPASRTSQLLHVRTSVDYVTRFAHWLKRFRGVATRYLPNYLIWHRMVDRPFRHSVVRTILRWPIGSGVP